MIACKNKNVISVIYISTRGLIICDANIHSRAHYADSRKCHLTDFDNNQGFLFIPGIGASGSRAGKKYLTKH